MSRSRKTPWVKDTHNTLYNRLIRHRINQKVRKMLFEENVELPNPRTIVNDYDICDYRWFVDEPKYKRK